MEDDRTKLTSYFIGDCQVINNYLKTKHGPAWGFIGYLNALFRGVGQVVFANNPWSGFIILACLYWGNLQVGFTTTVSATTAILTAIVFKIDDDRIVNGTTTYNAVLVGSVTASIWEPSYNQPLTPTVWGFIILCSSLSVLINNALGNIFGSFKPADPSFTLAFNIVTLLLFNNLQPRSDDAKNFSGRTLVENTTNLETGKTNFYPGVDILLVVEGVLLSMGEVYGIDHVLASVTMYGATMLYSPIVTIMSLIGATVGSFFGIVFDGPTYSNVYSGIWGFNAILAAIAVGAFFYIPSPISFAVAIADVALVVLVQQALTIAFKPLNLPFLTYPFVISTFFMLEITAKGTYLTRVKNFSYPEKHLREFRDKKKMDEEKMKQEMPKNFNSMNILMPPFLPRLQNGSSSPADHRFYSNEPSAPTLPLQYELNPQDFESNFESSESKNTLYNSLYPSATSNLYPEPKTYHIDERQGFYGASHAYNPAFNIPNISRIQDHIPNWNPSDFMLSPMHNQVDQQSKFTESNPNSYWIHRRR